MGRERFVERRQGANRSYDGVERRRENLQALCDETQCWRNAGTCTTCFSPALVELALPMEQALATEGELPARAKRLARAAAIAQSAHYAGEHVYFPHPTRHQDQRRMRARAWHARHVLGEPVARIARTLGVSLAHVYRMLDEADAILRATSPGAAADAIDAMPGPLGDPARSAAPPLGGPVLRPAYLDG